MEKKREREAKKTILREYAGKHNVATEIHRLDSKLIDTVVLSIDSLVLDNYSSSFINDFVYFLIRNYQRFDCVLATKL